MMKSNLNYIGSITIDQDILDNVELLATEKVQIVNNNNGARFEAYIISGKRGSKDICLNGAASRLVQPGDVVVITSYALISAEEAEQHQPKIAIMNSDNTIAEICIKKRYLLFYKNFNQFSMLNRELVLLCIYNSCINIFD